MQMENITSTASTRPRLTMVGTVSSIDPAKKTFFVDVVQPVHGSSQRSHLELYACLAPSVVQRLPIPNSIVTFTGQLFAVDEGTAVVVVDNIVYILS